MNGNKKTLFVTSLYSNLYGTKIGGRSSRLIHYLQSLETFLQMECDIVVYASEYDAQKIAERSTLSGNTRVKVIIEDIFAHPHHDFFQRKIKEYNIVNSDRCFEIMHSKPYWVQNHLDDGYDQVFWIDCGLCHGGLFPIRYRGDASLTNDNKCSLMNTKLVENLNKIDNKIFILVADQTDHVTGANPDQRFFNDNENPDQFYVVGGMFGGDINELKDFCKKYDDLFNRMLQLDSFQSEEQLLSFLFFRYKPLFSPAVFTTWHHEDSDMAQYNIENEIYFYNIFENLNK
jgi:hypothetical protein